MPDDAVDFAAVAYREDGAWRLRELEDDALEDLDSLIDELQRWPGDFGALGLVSVDDEFFLVVRVAGEDVRLLLSDVTAATEWPLAREVVDELVVDLTHAWDSAALLTVLARTRADLAERGGSLRLVGVALPEFLAALTAAPLDEVFLVYDAVRRNAEDTPSAPVASVERRVDRSP